MAESIEKKEVYKLEEESVIFLRKSKSGKGLYGFQPTPNRETPSKYMLIANISTMKSVIKGEEDCCALTVVKLEPRDEEPAKDDLDDDF